MAINTVPEFPPTLPDDSLKSGQRVRANDWRTLADMHNWLVGSGGQGVIANAPSRDIAVSGSALYRYYTRPRRGTWWIVWFLYVEPSGVSGTVADVQVQSNVPSTGSVITYRVQRSNPATQLIRHPVPMTALSESETELRLAVSCPAASPGGINVRMVSCIEVPRVQLDGDGTEYGAHLPSLQRGSVIHDGESTNRSITGLVHATEVVGGLRTQLAKLRRHHYHWSVDDSEALTTTSTSYGSITTSSTPIFLGRLHSDGQIIKVLKVRVRAGMSASNEGQAAVRFTMTNGDVVEISISNIGLAWSSAVNLDCDTEDLSAADGRRSSRNDVVAIDIKSETGKTLSISAISIYDDGVIT